MEKFSNTQKQTLGGPWKAVSSCKYFISYFPCCKIFYFFETKKLVSHLENLIKKKIIKSIEIYNKVGNRNWVTLGYIVPIESVLSVCQVCSIGL